jgi:hypothetical protein
MTRYLILRGRREPSFTAEQLKTCRRDVRDGRQILGFEGLCSVFESTDTLLIMPVSADVL